MSLKNFGEVDLCEDCVVTVTYGDKTYDSSGALYQRITDNLGVSVVFFDSKDDIDGHFCDCDGCGAQRLRVYSGNVLTEDEF